jgi:hypothetical protein
MTELMTLNTLLTRSYINNWDQHLWFKTAVLQGNRLAVADETHQRFITNCWKAVFAEHLPGIEIVVASTPQREKMAAAEKPKPSIYNKSGQAFIKAQQQRMDGME